MTYYVTSPAAAIEARRRMMRHLFENAFESERVYSFPMDVRSDQDQITVTALLPGLSTEEVNIQFNNGMLTIDGEYKNLRDEESQYVLAELPVGKFSRTLEINEPVVAEKIVAEMKDGVLTLRIPKAEEAKPKMIKVIAR
jgi:HSP20 family protein